MQRSKTLLVLLTMLACLSAVHPSAFEPARAEKRPVRWYKKTIQITVSSSLNSDTTSIRPQSDVVGAIHRALATWSAVTNLEFVEIPSDAQSASPLGRGDGINLITIAATPQNLALFRNDNSPARTRVFYDNETGEITEADIVINPFPYSLDGAPIDFSTDGSVGTYDLQSTLTHEIGHLLGLNHSAVFGATMNATQVLNGTFGLPALGGRTLSESDRAAALSLYSSQNDTGAIEGRIQNTRQGNLVPASSASVWIEDAATGRVMASALTDSNGDFKIGGITPGIYRMLAQYPDDDLIKSKALSLDSERATTSDGFRAVEIASRLRISARKSITTSYVLAPPQNSPASLRPGFIGTNVELSTVSLPAMPGSKMSVYVSGDGVEQVPANGLLISSPFLTIDPASLALHQYGNSHVLSFDVSIATDAPSGDYTVRLQAASGEIAYLIGALTVQPKQ